MKKLLSVFLCLMMIATSLSLASCGEDKEDPDTTTKDGDVTTSQTDPNYTPNLDASTNFGGRTFSILANGGAHWPCEDIDFDTTSEDPVDTAIYNRNRSLEQQYGFKIDVKYEESPVTAVQTAVAAGIEYNAVMMSATDTAKIASTGIFYDLHNVDNIDTTKHYWDQGLVDGLSINGSIFYLTGDITTSVGGATMIMLFNKNLKTKLDISDDFYQLVRDGKWTMDAFNSYMKGVSADLDNNGFDEKDQYAFATQIEAYMALFYGAGCSIITKDNAGMPIVSLNNDKTIKVIDKIYDLMQTNNKTIVAHDYMDLLLAGEWVNRDSFNEGRALFYCSIANGLNDFRDMKDDFGVLPLPKYDESQANYYSYVYNGAAVVSIPTSIQPDDLSFSGFVLEALAAKSKELVTPEFYEKTLKTKSQRDKESFEMLDIVFRNRVWDFGYICDWGKIYDSMNTQFKQGSGTFSSNYKRYERSIMKDMRDYIDACELANIV